MKGLFGRRRLLNAGLLFWLGALGCGESTPPVRARRNPANTGDVEGKSLAQPRYPLPKKKGAEKR